MSSARWLGVHRVAQAIVASEPGITKDRLAHDVARRFGLVSERSAHHAEDFSIRFVTARGASGNNCVLSLAALRRRDHIPFLVCILRSSGTDTLLANSTFIEKASHSSMNLSLGNVVGTFVLSNIAREYEGLKNAPENFEALFAMHCDRSWDDNLARIVERTQGIIPTGSRYHTSERDRELILRAVDVAVQLAETGGTVTVERELRARMEESRKVILHEASQRNVKLRGDAIEANITGRSGDHDLGDLSFTLGDRVRLLVDIKTKLIGKASSPKLYNVDKLLAALADGQTAVALFIIGIDERQGNVTGVLVNVLDEAIIRATRRDPRWSGRASRGSTQLAGDLAALLDPGFRPHIDPELATRFLRGLLDG